MKSYKTPLALALAAALTACASPSYTAKTYQTGQVQQAMKVKSATIVSVKEVEIQKKTGNAGAGVGAATGGVSGAMVGSSTNSVGNGLVGMVAGAVIGGVAGGITGGIPEPPPPPPPASGHWPRQPSRCRPGSCWPPPS